MQLVWYERQGPDDVCLLRIEHPTAVIIMIIIIISGMVRHFLPSSLTASTSLSLLLGLEITP